MNRRFSKFIAIAIVLIMAMQFTSAALAATVTWTSGSYTYVAEVIKGTASGTVPVNVTESETHHTNGTQNYIYSNTWSVTSTGDVVFPSPYVNRLRQAATAEGVNYTLTSNVFFSQDKKIPANYPSGTYCLVSTVTGIEGEYSVFKVGGGTSNRIKHGTFDCAPVGFTGAITGIYCMSLDDPIN